MLDQTLRLLHPVMPFVTDELWCALTGEDSVMMAAWPDFEFTDAAAEAEVGSLMRLVTEIRQFRSGQGLRPGQRVPARLAGIEATPLAAHEESVRALLRLTGTGGRVHRRAPPCSPRASPWSSTWPGPSTWRPSASGWSVTWRRPARKRSR